MRRASALPARCSVEPPALLLLLAGSKGEGAASVAVPVSESAGSSACALGDSASIAGSSCTALALRAELSALPGALRLPAAAESATGGAVAAAQVPHWRGRRAEPRERALRESLVRGGALGTVGRNMCCCCCCCCS